MNLESLITLLTSSWITTIIAFVIHILCVMLCVIFFIEYRAFKAIVYMYDISSAIVMYYEDILKNKKATRIRFRQKWTEEIDTFKKKIIWVTKTPTLEYFLNEEEIEAIKPFYDYQIKLKNIKL